MNCSVAHLHLTGTTWPAAHQAYLSHTISQSLPKFLASVMLSSHLTLWGPLLLLPSICPSIRDFSNESSVHIRWPNTGASASASVLPVNIQSWSPLSPQIHNGKNYITYIIDNVYEFLALKEFNKHKFPSDWHPEEVNYQRRSANSESKEESIHSLGVLHGRPPEYIRQQERNISNLKEFAFLLGLTNKRNKFRM